MNRQLDKIVVIDVEATCWEGARPEGQENEIIEIGVCTLDLTTGERAEKESIIVRPVRSTMSAFCTQLTGLTPEVVAGGIPFKEACASLVSRYKVHERTWASYGDYDRKQFGRDCLAHGIAYPFGPSHINVKALAAQALGLDRPIGMDKALRKLGMPLEGRHHCGADDAWNIAAILWRVRAALGQTGGHDDGSETLAR